MTVLPTIMKCHLDQFKYSFLDFKENIYNKVSVLKSISFYKLKVFCDL